MQIVYIILTRVDNTLLERQGRSVRFARLSPPLQKFRPPPLKYFMRNLSLNFLSLPSNVILFNMKNKGYQKMSPPPPPRYSPAQSNLLHIFGARALKLHPLTIFLRQAAKKVILGSPIKPLGFGPLLGLVDKIYLIFQRLHRYKSKKQKH